MKRKFFRATKIIGKNTGSIEAWFEEPVSKESNISFDKSNWFYNNLPKININYKYKEPNYKYLSKELNHYTKNKLKNFNENQLNEHNIYTGLNQAVQLQ